MEKISLLKIFDKIVKRLLEETKRYYGKRLVSFVVFGSVGRKTPTYESDIDFLIVAEDLPDGRMKRIGEFYNIEKRLKKEIENLDKNGIFTGFSPIIKTKEDVLKGGYIYLDMVYDANILFDKGKFFTGYLSSLREKLNRLGAKRVNEGGRWYWDLKFDYSPREIFEI